MRLLCNQQIKFIAVGIWNTHSLPLVQPHSHLHSLTHTYSLTIQTRCEMKSKLFDDIFLLFMPRTWCEEGYIGNYCVSCPALRFLSFCFSLFFFHPLHICLSPYYKTFCLFYSPVCVSFNIVLLRILTRVSLSWFHGWLHVLLVLIMWANLSLALAWSGSRANNTQISH